MILIKEEIKISDKLEESFGFTFTSIRVFDCEKTQTFFESFLMKVLILSDLRREREIVRDLCAD